MNIKTVYGACVVCGGDIKKRFKTEYCALRDKHRDMPLDGYYCKDCGIYYVKLPNEKVMKEIKEKDDDIVRMSPRARNIFNKSLSKLEKSLKKK